MAHQNNTLQCIENEIEILRPLLGALNELLDSYIKQYEQQEKYEICSLLIKYHHEAQELGQVFERLENYAVTQKTVANVILAKPKGY